MTATPQVMNLCMRLIHQATGGQGEKTSSLCIDLKFGSEAASCVVLLSVRLQYFQTEYIYIYIDESQ